MVFMKSSLKGHFHYRQKALTLSVLWITPFHSEHDTVHFSSVWDNGHFKESTLICNRSFTEVYKRLSPSMKQLMKNGIRVQESTWSKSLLKSLDDQYKVFISLSSTNQSYFVFVLNCIFTNWVLRILVFIQAFVCES